MFHKLRTGLFPLCTVIVVATITLLTLTNFFIARKHSLETPQNHVQQLTLSIEKTISEWLEAKRSRVTSLTSVATKQDIKPFLNAAKAAGKFDQVYIGYSDKRFIFSDPVPALPSGYSPTKRPWYIKAAEEKAPIVTNPYTSASTGKRVVTFAEPVGESAVVAADVTFDAVAEVITAIKPTPNSFAMLVDEEGMIIVHSDKSFQMKPATAVDASLTQDALALLGHAYSSISVVTHGRKGMLFAIPIKGSRWMLAVVLDYDEATAGLSSMPKLQF